LLVAGVRSRQRAGADLGLNDVAERARLKPRSSPVATPFAELAALTYDGYRDIRFNADSTSWRADKLPFEANFSTLAGKRRTAKSTKDTDNFLVTVRTG
jgi:glucans biosynthesis protein